MAKKVLYHPGCVSRIFLKNIVKNYEAILKMIGVGFVSMEDNKLLFCCGKPLLNAGLQEEYLKFVEGNENNMKELNIASIISNCPGCVKAFNDEYAASAVHVSKFILENIKKFERRGNNEKITYFQPCDLRKLNDDYPEKILRELGFDVIKVDDACCGAGGNLKFYSPRIAGMIGKKLLSKIKTKKVITACPMCYMHLKENAKDTDIFVMELSEVLV